MERNRSDSVGIALGEPINRTISSDVRHWDRESRLSLQSIFSMFSMFSLNWIFNQSLDTFGIHFH